MADQPSAAATDEPAVRENVAEHRFELWADGELAGFTAYEPIGDVRAFLHTEIDDRFGGRGYGSVLVRAAMTAMQESGTPVLPFCPFVRTYLKRHPELRSVVPDEERGRFGLRGDTAPA